MKYTWPFDITTGTEGTGTFDWQDANLPQGFEGSIPSAAFFKRTQMEIVNAIIEAGITPSNDDLGQLSEAMVLNHKIVENRTIYVPGDFDSLFDALEYLSGKIIPSSVYVTILLGAGDIEVDSITGPLLLDQPYGSRIRIQGQPLTGTGFPTIAEVNQSNKPAVEALLRSRFPSRIVVNGGTFGLFLKSGTFSQISRLCIIGDGADSEGICIGQFRSDIGTGNIGLENVYVFNTNATGIRSNYAAAITCNNVAASHCNVGFDAGNTSSIQMTGTAYATRCTAAGMQIRDQGLIELLSGATASFKNNGNGVQCIESGSFVASNLTSLDIGGNSGAGVLTNHQSYSAISRNTVGGSNGSGDIVTTDMGHAYIRSPTSLTMSPAANTLGNNNSFNTVN